MANQVRSLVERSVEDYLQFLRRFVAGAPPRSEWATTTSTTTTDRQDVVGGGGSNAPGGTATSIETKKENGSSPPALAAGQAGGGEAKHGKESKAVNGGGEGTDGPPMRLVAAFRLELEIGEPHEGEHHGEHHSSNHTMRASRAGVGTTGNVHNIQRGGMHHGGNANEGTLPADGETGNQLAGGDGVATLTSGVVGEGGNGGVGGGIHNAHTHNTSANSTINAHMDLMQTHGGGYVCIQFSEPLGDMEGKVVGVFENIIECLGDIERVEHRLPGLPPEVSTPPHIQAVSLSEGSMLTARREIKKVTDYNHSVYV